MLLTSLLSGNRFVNRKLQTRETIKFAPYRCGHCIILVGNLEACCEFFYDSGGNVKFIQNCPLLCNTDEVDKVCILFDGKYTYVKNNMASEAMIRYKVTCAG